MRHFLLFLAVFNLYFGFLTYNLSTALKYENRFFNSKKLKRSTYIDSQSRDLSPPKILIDIPLLVKFRYNVFRLECKAFGNPFPTIKWYNHTVSNIRYNGFTQIRDYDINTNDPVGNLDISNISPKIAGSYFCSASNILGTVFSRKAEVPRIYLSKDISIMYETEDIKVFQKAVIECIVKPDIYVKDFVIKHWEIKFNEESSQMITKTEGRFSVINLSKYPQFHIRNVTENDFRDLQVKCLLEHKFSTKVIELDQWVRPKKLKEGIYSDNINYDKCKGTEISEIQGSTIELPWCSSPTTPEVIWFKSNSSTILNGEMLTTGSSKFSLVSQRYGNLLIKNIDISDEGYYFVKKDYKVLQDYPPFHLKVTVRIGLKIYPPDAHVALGKSVTFRCEITGYPVTDIFWLHNGNYQKYNTMIRSDHKTAVTTLVINEVTTESAGSYQCVAESRNIFDNTILDCAQQASSVVIIEMSPYLVSQSPLVPNKETYATVKLDSTFSSESIQCSFNSTPKAVIQWYLDDKPIPIYDVISVYLSSQDPYTITSSLKIDLRKLNSIGDKWQYGGMYTAVATNKFGSAQCKTLIFIEGEFMIRDQGKVTLKHGQKTTLKCNVISSDIPEITWSKIKDGKNIKFPDTHLETESRDRREIFISFVNKEIHDASYECNATFGGKTISKIFKISVARPPLGVTEFQEDDILYERSIIENNCQPKPNLDLPWYAWWEFRSFQAANNKCVIIAPSGTNQDTIVGVAAHWRSHSGDINNYEELPDVPSGVPSFLKSYPNMISKLVITFNKKLHMGNFTCVIQNNAGIVKRSFRITIAVIEFDIEPPSKKNVTLGDSFILHCSAKRNELATTTVWSNNDIPIPLYGTYLSSRIYRFNNGTLVGKDFTDADPTEFLCMIKSNSTLAKISKLVQISLQVPARILPMPNETDVVMKSNYNLVCHVYGDLENLHIKWMREEGEDNWRSIEIQNMHFFKTEGKTKKVTLLSLEFRNAVEGLKGRYKCVARNSYSKSNSEKIVKVSIVAVPGPISMKFTETRTEARSVTMEWLEPSQNGNKPILDYLITWKSGNVSFELNVTKQQVKIEGLRPNNEYNFSIGARNEVGIGEQCSVTVTTLEAPPDGPVVNLTAHSNSSTSLVITWKPPNILLQNGKIVSYSVCYRRVASKQSSVVVKELPWPVLQNTHIRINELRNKNSDIDFIPCVYVNVTKCVLKDLPKFTEYEFRVGPLNKMGVGPFDFTKVMTLEDFPEKAPVGVTCTPSSTTIILQWNPPSQESINGVLLGYMVKYFRPEFYGMERDGLVDLVLETKVSLQSLIPYSNYSMQVAVVNKKGAGPMSAPLICVTNMAPPSAPDVVKAFSYNDSCVLVVWSPPLAPNGPLEQYCINVSNVKKVDCLKADTKHWYHKHTVCELKKGREYVYAVTACNKLCGLPGKSPPLRITHGDNVIVSIARNVVVTDRETVVLHCETINGNHQRPTWFFYSTPSSPSKEINFSTKNYCLESNGSLIISNSSKATNGTYKCVLPTSSINYTVSVTIVESGIPKMAEIYYHTSSLTSISISWRSPGSPRPDDPITSFSITISNNESMLPVKVDYMRRNYTLTNLTCGTLYHIYLKATNKAGDGPPAIVKIHTLGSKPQWANSTSLLFGQFPRALCFRLTSFLPGQGCPPHKFIVNLISTSPPLTIDNKSIRLPCNNITGLHPNTEYNYKIEAINNAGSTFNEGYAKTTQMLTVDPKIERNHNNGFLYFINSYKFYIAFVFVLIVVIIIFIGIAFFCIRKSYEERIRPPIKVNNNVRTSLPQQPINIGTPSISHRNRRLPAPPCNTYDSGITTVSQPKIQEEDDDLKPYATYAPIGLPESLSPNTRAKQGKKSLANDPTAYIGGSQTHSYQYPDMAGSSQQPTVTSMDIHNNANTLDYTNSAKQPLLKSRAFYSKGYSVGGDAHCPLLSQRPTDSICQEAYRPGGSTWSNTTGSSTKELTQVFHPNYSADFQSGLREQDEDNCSTTRAGTLTALPNRMRPSDEFNHTESYFESGSSGDDPGIQNFTQERFAGQQAVEPRFTHAPLPYIRQSSTASSIYSSVDDPLSRNMSGSLMNPGTSSFHPNRFLVQDTLTEEDEQNNYQNKFVIV